MPYIASSPLWLLRGFASCLNFGSWERTYYLLNPRRCVYFVFLRPVLISVRERGYPRGDPCNTYMCMCVCVCIYLLSLFLSTICIPTLTPPLSSPPSLPLPLPLPLYLLCTRQVRQDERWWWVAASEALISPYMALFIIMYSLGTSRWKRRRFTGVRIPTLCTSFAHSRFTQRK
jgi:hypothetical protein